MSGRIKGWRVFLLLVTAVPAPGPLGLLPLFVAIAPAQSHQAQVSRPNLEAIPFPDVSAMDESVRKQLSDFQTELMALSRSPATTEESMAEAYGRAGMVYHTYDLVVAAAACYRNAHRLAPEDSRWSYYLAVVHQSRGEFDKASTYFEKALNRGPSDLASLLGLARAKLGQGHPEEAQRLFEQALERDPSLASALLGLGDIAARRSDFKSAVDYFERALQLQPEASSIHYPLAMAYRQLGDVAEARLHLSKRGDVAPSFPDPLKEELARVKTGRWLQRWRGTKASDSGNYEQAAQMFGQMVAADPDDPIARWDLGTALFQLDQVEEAVVQFEAALRYSSSKSRIHFNMAVAFTQMGWEERAIEHYRSAVGIDSGFKEAYFQLANVLMRKELLEEAIQQYGRVVELDPSNGFAHFMRAMALVRVQRWGEARSGLEKGLAALPDDSDLGHALARLLAACPQAKIRDGRRALQILQEVFKREKSAEFEHVETLAMAYAEVGQFDRAVQVQQMMIQEVTRGNRAELPKLFQENLARYERREACRQPWRDDDPVFHLAPVPFALLRIQ